MNVLQKKLIFNKYAVNLLSRCWLVALTSSELFWKTDAMLAANKLLNNPSMDVIFWEQKILLLSWMRMNCEPKSVWHKGINLEISGQ